MKQTKSIRSFILNYLQKEYSFGNDEIDTINYVEGGYIDSLAMIKFVVALEEEFGIQFSDDELSLPDFMIVGGLIKLIEAKVGQNGNLRFSFHSK